MISLDIRCIKDSDDICAYFNRYEYDVLFATDDNSDVVIGKGVVVLYLCGKALNDGFDIIMAFDENHHEGVYDILFDCDSGNDGLNDFWEDIMTSNDVFNQNILVSDRLEILPEYRHKGYGKVVRSLKRDFFNGCYGIEILHSYPLQLELFDNNKDEWRAQQHYEEMEQDTKKAFDSLNKCYKKDGYKRYKRTEYFYRLGE